MAQGPRLIDVAEAISLAPTVRIASARDSVWERRLASEVDVLFALAIGTDPPDAVQHHTVAPPPNIDHYAEPDAALDQMHDADLLPYPDELLPEGAAQTHDLDVDAFFSACRAAGLLAGLTDEEIGASRNRARRLENAYAPGWLYRCLPRRVVYFDWEGASVDGAYAELLRLFERAGRGAFALSDIEDEFPAFGDGGPYPGSFVLGGKTYTFASAGNGDWLDATFLATLQAALQDQGVGGRFHTVIDDGQASGSAFFYDAELDELPEGLIVED